MEELKIIITAFSGMQENVKLLFLFWCLKEIIIYLMCPITFLIIGKVILKIYNRERGVKLDESLIQNHERYMHSAIE